MGAAGAEVVTRAIAWRLFCWGLVVAWLAVIWRFGESQVLPLPSSEAARVWLLRKWLHLVVYGVLGGLLTLAAGPGPRRGRLIGLCLLVALGDEWHQSLVPHRSFRVSDLGIDLLGVSMGVWAEKLVMNVVVFWRREEFLRV